jgi:hypothetical protein
MEREEYIKHIKKLIKTYHPDLCHDENLRDTYNEITIKLNMALNNLEDNKTTKVNENIPENKNFNVFSFRYYLSKIQSIGISKNSISSKDFIIFRNFLVSEINKNDKKIGEYFSVLLSDKNIMSESINLFVNAYANYTSIFQNYYQYNEQMVKQCARIGDSYFNDYVKKSEIKEINEMIDGIKKWFQKIIKIIYNQRYCT